MVEFDHLHVTSATCIPQVHWLVAWLVTASMGPGCLPSHVLPPAVRVWACGSVGGIFRWLVSFSDSPLPDECLRL